MNRILSPGRVSPIDSAQEPFHHANAIPTRSAKTEKAAPQVNSDLGRDEAYDVRLNLKGKDGGVLVLELNSRFLAAKSEVFAALIANCSSEKKIYRIEVPEVKNLVVFRETIELMFEEDITKRLMRIGVYRALDILEVSASVRFNDGVLSCLKYIEAVPWTEEEEEKLRKLFSRFKFDHETTGDILARLYPHDSVDYCEQNLAKQVIYSITTCSDSNARNELKSSVKGLLCRSSVYEKELISDDVSKDDLYAVCQSCMGSLVKLFAEEATTMTNKPPIEQISRQVDNINWLLEIMLDQQIAEEFVHLWANQEELLKLHESSSPMVRYELSRVSANLFIALSMRKLQCHSNARSGLFQAWFGPMLGDYGWLQRCRKGLDMRALQEAMGEMLLTLSLKQQYALFMQWFRFFSKHGSESPNLSKAFQIWWRRSFLRGSETNAIESR